MAKGSNKIGLVPATLRGGRQYEPPNSVLGSINAPPAAS
jgi:hypothetical protein